MKRLLPSSNLNFKHACLSGLLPMLLGGLSIQAATYNASSEAQLISAINNANGAAGADTISIDANITLASVLPAISDDVTVDGNSFTLDANSSGRPFLITSGTVLIQDLEISNGLSQGGAGENSINGGGGGGGAGMGGAIFVNTGADVTLNSVTFTGNRAYGGASGDSHVAGASAGQNGGAGGAGPFGAGAAGGTSISKDGQAAVNFGSGAGGGWGSALDDTTGGNGGASGIGAGGGGGGGGGLNTGLGDRYLVGSGGLADWPTEDNFMESYYGSGRDSHDGQTYDSGLGTDVFDSSYPAGLGGGGGGGSGLGGAVFVRDGGALTVIDCYFAQNEALGGGIGKSGRFIGAGLGAAIYAMPTVTVEVDLITFGITESQANVTSSRSIQAGGSSNPAHSDFVYDSRISTNNVYGTFTRLNPLPTPSDNGGANDAPVLTNTGAPYLDHTVRNADYSGSNYSFDSDLKTSVSTLISRLRSPGITDADADTPGIAITDADDTNGTWQYQLSGSVSPQVFGPRAAVEINGAYDESGSPINQNNHLLFKVKAAGVAGNAFQLQIIDSNGANTVALEGNILTYRVELPGFTAQDAVDLLEANIGLSAQFSVEHFNVVADSNGSGQLVALAPVNFAGVVSDETGLLLEPNSKLYFVPDTDFITDGNTAPTMTFRAWDQSVGIAGAFVDTSLNGGATAFSSAVESAQVDVLVPLLDTGLTLYEQIPQDSYFDPRFHIDTLFADRDAAGVFGNPVFNRTVVGVGGVWAAGSSVSSMHADIRRAPLLYNVAGELTGVLQFASLRSASFDTNVASQKIYNHNIFIGDGSNPSVDDDAEVDQRDTVDIDVLANDEKYFILQEILSFDATSVEGGTVSESGGVLTYTPPANFVGADSFTYIGQTASAGSSASGEATVNITVNALSNVEFSQATYTVNEDGTAVGTAVTLTRDDATAAASVELAYTNGTATGGSDFTATSVTINFAVNEASKVVNLAILNDTIVEPNENFTVSLTALTNCAIAAQGRATITLVSDDTALLSIDDAEMNESDAGTTSYTFTVTLDKNVTNAVSVDFSTADSSATQADSDYVNTSGTLNFTGTAGETETITVTVNGDAKVELDETFLVNLSNPLTGRSRLPIGFTDSQGIGTITNDDAATLSINDVVLAEGNTPSTTNYTFTVTSDAAVDTVFTVDYATQDNSATVANSDYVAKSNSLSFAGNAGEMQQFSIIVNGDDAHESTESFFVNLSNIQASGRDVSLADGQGEGTLVHDDNVPPVLDLNGGAAGINSSEILNFTEDDPLLNIISNTTTLSDVANDGITSATATITNFADGDSLSATGTANIVVTPYNPTTGILSFTGADTLSAYLAVLKTIQFTNSSENPNETARVVTLRVIDDNANGSTAGPVVNTPQPTIMVGVANKNDQPTTSGLSDINKALDDISQDAVALFGAFDDVDNTDEELILSITGNTNEALFAEISIDERTGTLNLAYPYYAKGSSNLTLRATDPDGLFIETELMITLAGLKQPEATGLSQLTFDNLNPQTGLLEHEIEITNTSINQIGGFEITITGLPSEVSAFNANGEDALGNPTVTFFSTVEPGASVSLLIEYLTADRGLTAFSPIYSIALIPIELPEATPTGTTFQISRLIDQPDGSKIVEFNATYGKFYIVQFSEDLSVWVDTEPRIEALANVVQWIDNGPPKTPSLPADTGSRFYQIIEVD